MAPAFAPKLSPVLMTPEPHYLPGYCGYCPRYKFTLGQTYGKLTSQLLAAPSRPGRLLLLPNCSPGTPEERPGPGGRGGGCGAIPGYTGFIPRAQNHFAKTYGEVCRRAWQDFAPHQEQDARGRDQVWEAMGAPRLDVRVLIQGEEQARALTHSSQAPLRLTVGSALLRSQPLPARPEARSAAAATPAFRPPGSPLALERCGPQATFVSGFTGFVPRIQFLIGASYPILAHQAMAEFDQMLRKTGQAFSRGGETLPPLAKTYPTDRGLLPHYRGYVPGYKFQFGHTYGHLTCNALGQTTLEKQALAVTQ
ncbi:ciliary microtubule inner protein 2B [Candoia aspera]|uniref:ciliary microtubule inner protein 2B n=1 Tax=Candoia aspera TaxID=51853 RepID=UPI002FD7BBE7